MALRDAERDKPEVRQALRTLYLEALRHLYESEGDSADTQFYRGMVLQHREQLGLRGVQSPYRDGTEPADEFLDELARRESTRKEVEFEHIVYWGGQTVIFAVHAVCYEKDGHPKVSYRHIYVKDSGWLEREEATGLFLTFGKELLPIFRRKALEKLGAQAEI